MTDTKNHPLNGVYLFPFISPPNGGKGTQTKALSDYFNVPKVDMGGMLREVAKEDSDLGRTVRDTQAQGKLVDLDIVMAVLEDGLRKQAEASPGLKAFILDGFPRNEEQTRKLFALSEQVGAPIATAVYLAVPNEVIIDRAANRLFSPSGEIYNLKTKPPQNPGVCDVTGEALFQREDDKPEKVKVRLDSFDKDTAPILSFFKDKGLLTEVNGNRDPEVITEDLKKLMVPYLSPARVG